jgi:SsrA-binding protein
VTDFARNRKAFHDFAVEETGEVFLLGAHISPYGNATNIPQHPTRDRKLLLHRGEISRLAGKSQEDGKTLIPLRLYDRKGNIKLELAVASRKKQYDKRREIARRTADREMERAMKERLRR